MNDYTMWEDVSAEEYEEAMEGYEEWLSEIQAEIWKDINEREWD